MTQRNIPEDSQIDKLHEVTFKGVGTLLSLTGPWGVVLGKLLGGLAEKRKEERLKEFVTLLDTEVRKVGGQVAEKVSEEEAQAIAERTILYAVNEPLIQKRKAFAAILAGAITDSNSIEEHTRCIRVCEMLSTFDLHVIHQIIATDQQRQGGGVTYQPYDLLRKRLGNPPEETLDDSIFLLTNQGILNGDMNIRVNTSDPSQMLYDFLAGFGKRFVKYLRD